MFKAEFKTENAAFACDMEGEAARILKLIASQIERGSHGASIKDINGNTVGRWELERR